MTRSVGNVTAAASTPPTFVRKSGNSSGTYTSPAGCSYIIVHLSAGGGSGARNSVNYFALAGGGGGAYYKFKAPSGTYSYSIGDGGSGASSFPGATGGNSTFGTAVCGAGGGGGSQVSGALNSSTLSYTSLLFVPGGLADTQRTSFKNNYSSTGGSSFYGRNSVMQNPNGLQDCSTFRGGGGNGVQILSSPSGAGGYGYCLIEEYY
tara:strand:+ start:5368 stop:5985 length:618 start_codon:yes stop_codon:yes gene_type:complete